MTATILHSTAPTTSPTPAPAPAPSASPRTDAVASAGVRGRAAAGEVVDRDLASVAATDVGNAERFVARHAARVRFCHTRGSWLLWDGTRWKPDDTEQVLGLATDTVRGVYREAATLGQGREELAKHAVRSERAERLTAMLRLARAHPEIAATAAVFDRDPWLLNLANGSLHLPTGQLRPHDPADLLTLRSDIHYDPQASCPRWEAFLTQVLVEPAVVGYVRQLFSYALSGTVSDQALYLLYGDGANGKTTLLNVLLALAGEYGRQASPDLLLADRHDTHPTVLAELEGARPVVAAEVNEHRRFDEAVVKQLTGADRITARRMRQDHHTFAPTHTLLLAVNHLPDIRARDHGTWRRIRPIAFPTRITADRRDPNLAQRLTAELPGILTWATTATGWHTTGQLAVPTAIERARDRYRTDTDPLDGFLTHACRLDPAATTPARVLYQAYLDWHRDHGEHQQLSRRGFGMALTRRGLTTSKSGTIHWHGITTS